MKIAIVGAHGVGKTTLSKLIAKEFNLPIIPDVVVEAQQKGFTINENTPLETQFWLFARQLELEKNMGDSWVADKCLIDYSVYADVLLPDDRAKTLLAEMISRNADYDYIFYLPIEFPIKADGIRSTDPVFQKNIADRYLTVLNNWGNKFHIVSGSVAERLTGVLRKIKGIKIEKKTWPEYFEQILRGDKKFECRIADFDCQVGDILVLKEWDPKTGQYTGRQIEKTVTYVLKTKETDFYPAAEVQEYGFQIMTFD